MRDKRRTAALAICLLAGAAALSAGAPQDILQVDLPDHGFETSLNSIIAQRLGMHEPYRAELEADHLSDSMNNVRKVVFEDGGQRVPVVIKSYSEAGRMWRMRFRKELKMNAAFRAAGLETLDILVAVPSKGITVTRFLDNAVLGTEVMARARRNDPQSLGLIEQVGKELSAAHRDNLCVRDFKDDNVMVSRGRAVFIDLDESGSCVGPMNFVRAWDIAWFFYWATMGNPQEDEGPAINAFVKGYLENGGSARVVREAAGTRCALLASRYDKRFGELKKSSPDAFERMRRELRAAADAGP